MGSVRHIDSKQLRYFSFTGFVGFGKYFSVICAKVFKLRLTIFKSKGLKFSQTTGLNTDRHLLIIHSRLKSYCVYRSFPLVDLFVTIKI